MSTILFTDLPVCQLMAEQAMQDPEYKSLLKRAATRKEARRELTIENDITKFRHKLLMLNQIEHGSYQHRRRGLDIEKCRNKCALLSVGRAPSILRRALTLLAEKERLQTNPKAFPLLRLPLEIRQQIYDEVLSGTNRKIVVKSFDVSAFKDDYPNRDVETFYGNRASPHWKNPASTFECALPSFFGKDITTGLLLVSKSIYAETIPILYNSRVFDFGVDVFGIIPFLRKMTPLARESVHNIHMELYALPIHKLKKPVFQHHQDVRGNAKDWTEACTYIADNLQLKQLSINVSTEVHEAIQSPVDLSLLQWVKDLVQIQGLQSLSYHISPNGHGLNSLRPRVDPPAHAASSKGFAPGPDDVVDGDVKGAKPGLGRLFRYLRREMLEKSTHPDPCL